MLRRDTSATFEKTGVSIFSRYRFRCAGFVAPRSLNRGAYEALRRAQAEIPQLVAEDRARKRRWWLHRDEFFWEDEALEQREVLALILQRESQRTRRVSRAVALMEQADPPADSRREMIPDAVRAFVWNRDGGRCSRCGAQERLEFDHIIPLALGGGNTARNLQLLCETCNRAKGASVV
jgi:5-methylcytosine-specific restriction endonuclease McrA